MTCRYRDAAASADSVPSDSTHDNGYRKIAASLHEAVRPDFLIRHDLKGRVYPSIDRCIEQGRIIGIHPTQ